MAPGPKAPLDQAAPPIGTFDPELPATTVPDEIGRIVGLDIIASASLSLSSENFTAIDSAYKLRRALRDLDSGQGSSSVKSSWDQSKEHGSRDNAAAQTTDRSRTATIQA